MRKRRAENTEKRKICDWIPLLIFHIFSLFSLYAQLFLFSVVKFLFISVSKMWVHLISKIESLRAFALLQGMFFFPCFIRLHFHLNFASNWQSIKKCELSFVAVSMRGTKFSLVVSFRLFWQLMLSFYCFYDFLQYYYFVFSNQSKMLSKAEKSSRIWY